MPCVFVTVATYTGWRRPWRPSARCRTRAGVPSTTYQAWAYPYVRSRRELPIDAIYAGR